MSIDDVARFVDYTLLQAEATGRDIDTLCDVARRAHYAAVCVNGLWVTRARERLEGSGVSVATVVGFPLGAHPQAVKGNETRELVDLGAQEIDMVISLGHLLDGDVAYVTEDIRRVVHAAGSNIVKCILETALLDRDQIVHAARAARDAGAQFVKTSTGFHPRGGATEAAVALLAEIVGDSMGVKASGGIKTLGAARRMLAAGATRIGTSTDLSMSDA